MIPPELLERISKLEQETDECKQETISAKNMTTALQQKLDGTLEKLEQAAVREEALRKQMEGRMDTADAALNMTNEAVSVHQSSVALTESCRRPQKCLRPQKFAMRFLIIETLTLVCIAYMISVETAQQPLCYFPIELYIDCCAHQLPSSLVVRNRQKQGATDKESEAHRQRVRHRQTETARDDELTM